jgi:putative efflux protein, MATE family
MKAEETVHGDFTKGPMWRNIMRIAIPMMVAQLVNIIYNLADRIFIDRMPGGGSVTITALGLSLPVLSLVMAFANLCGVGGAPLFAIARGEKNEEEARHILGNTFTLILLLSAVLTAAGLILCKQILMLFGASQETIGPAYQYLFINLLGTPLVMIGLGMNPFINAQDFPKFGMISVAAGALFNLILDPIFIFVLGWGIVGAAVSNLIGQAASCIWVLWFLRSRKTECRLESKYMRLNGKRVLDICSLGMTGFIMSATNSIVGVTNNTMLQAWGGDMYVGIMTVIAAVREVVTLPLSGLVNGAQPVLSYNLGAKEYGRLRKGIAFAIIAPMIYNVVTWSLIMLTPGVFVRLFNAEGDLLANGIPAVRIYFSFWIFMGLQMSVQPVFVALRRTKTAVFFSMLRKVILVVPLVLILPGLGFGAHGVFWAEAISALVGGTLAMATMYVTVMRPLRRMEEGYL